MTFFYAEPTFEKKGPLSEDAKASFGAEKTRFVLKDCTLFKKCACFFHCFFTFLAIEGSFLGFVAFYFVIFPRRVF